jgi:hypothetical protein
MKVYFMEITKKTEKTHEVRNYTARAVTWAFLLVIPLAR